MLINQMQSALYSQMVSQRMTFDPSIDCRNDLVNLYGYTRQQVNAMSDDELFSIMDGIEATEKGYNTTPEYNLIPIPCGHCDSKQMLEIDYSDHDDCYTLKCPKCSRESHIHYTGYDSFMDRFYDHMEGLNVAEDQTITEPVKVAEDLRTLEELDFSVRVHIILTRNRIKNAEEIKQLSLLDLQKMRNMGRNSINEIEEKLNIKFM